MYSKGISWIDDARIPFVDGVEKPSAYQARKGGFQDVFVGGTTNNIQDENTKGRFPANILVCDDMLNDGIKPNKGHRAKSKVTGYGEFGGGKNEYHGIGEYMEVDSKSRYYDIDKWFNNLIDV